jgi:GNAT superfamily N-acetyltransferase
MSPPTDLKWTRDRVPARWDEDKRAIVGTEAGIFDYTGYGLGDVVPGDWWRVQQDGRTVGFGWMDVVWGDAQILLAVAPDARGQGIGTFILRNLEQEAARQGLNYLFNVIPRHHPEPDRVAAWLAERGFSPSHEDRLSRRVVAP